MRHRPTILVALLVVFDALVGKRARASPALVPTQKSFAVFVTDKQIK
jgi:hypothetical protein